MHKEFLLKNLNFFINYTNMNIWIKLYRYYIMFNILLVGSGWASASFIKNIDTGKYNLSVVAPTNKFTYTPLLANNIRNKNDLEVNINSLNSITYIKDFVEDIDHVKNQIITKTKRELKYDYLVLAHGSEINTFNIKGVRENCHFIKSAHDSEKIKQKLQDLPYNSTIAVIGCSLTGSEIIGNLIDYDKFNIYAFDGLTRPLTIFSKEISQYTTALWKRNNVKMYMDNFVDEVGKEKIYCKDNELSYDLAIWCGGIKKSILSDLINKRLNLKCKFGIPVNNYLRVKNTKNIYAMGDCAFSRNPTTAQVAYQQGKYLANHFNHNFNQTKQFNFINKGQIGYIGRGESVYQKDHIYFKGKLTGYLNNFIHLYNRL